MKVIFLTLIVSLTLFGSSNNYEVGKALYNDRGCSNCHGTYAEGSGSYPKLANRSKKFLLYKLKEFRAGRSTKQIQQVMFGFAKNLNDKEMDALTTFLSNYKEESNDKYQLDYDIIGGDN